MSTVVEHALRGSGFALKGVNKSPYIIFHNPYCIDMGDDANVPCGF
jgi:hypothetical protein